MDTVEILKVLADESRIRIAALINDCPCFVSDIHQILGLQQSNTSRHLQRLVASKIVSKKQCGQSTCYYFEPSLFENYPMIATIIETYKQEVQYKSDVKKFEKYLKAHPEMSEKLKKYRMLKEQIYA